MKIIIWQREMAIICTSNNNYHRYKYTKENGKQFEHVNWEWYSISLANQIGNKTNLISSSHQTNEQAKKTTRQFTDVLEIKVLSNLTINTVLK